MLVGIVFNVERESLQALLPEGYVVDQAVQPTVIFEAMHLRNLPWLNGRGGQQTSPVEVELSRDNGRV